MAKIIFLGLFFQYGIKIGAFTNRPTGNMRLLAVPKLHGMMCQSGAIEITIGVK